MARSPIVTCSPVASSMSISRGSGFDVMAAASPRRPSVVFPMADTTTTIRWPCEADSATRRATFRIFSGSATDDPPNFCTISWLMREPSYTSVEPTAKARRVALRSPLRRRRRRLRGPRRVRQAHVLDEQENDPVERHRHELRGVKQQRKRERLRMRDLEDVERPDGCCLHDTDVTGTRRQAHPQP